jgi:hypothetical protein
MILGSKVAEDRFVRHSRASQSYMVLLFILLAILLVFVAVRGHWFAVVFALRFFVAVWQICSGRVTERGHKKTFIYLSNWEMAFLLSMYVRTVSPVVVAQFVVLGALIILANVAYYHDERANRALMLRFGRAMQT